MEQLDRYFLDILRAALRGEEAALPEELTAEQWERLMTLAQTHNVLPMVYEAVYRQPGFAGTPLEAVYKQQVMRQVFMQTKKTSEFLALNKKLREAGVTPLVVKGIICRNLYPLPDHRQSGDEDLLIPEERFPAAHQALLDFGMETAVAPEDFAARYEIPYGKKGSPLYIELHKHLFPPESEAYGDLNRFFEGIFHRAAEETIEVTPVSTMAPTDHLFYLICHAFKHFLHSGFGIRQVCDINLFARRYGEGIDWEQVLENCRAIRAEKFAAAMFRIGRNHLGVEVPMRGGWQALEVDEGPMLEDLLQAGVFGGADMSRKHSSTITLTAVANRKQGKSTGGGVMKSLFPSASALEGRYPYLKKHPALLPVAWVSRIAAYGRETAAGSNNNAAESVKIGNRRIEMMKQYGILDE